MKRGTTPTLLIEHGLNLEAVRSVEFLFKQTKQEHAQAILIKRYPEEVTAVDGIFYIPFTVAETRRFKENENFYCDPKIVLIDGDIPATEILTLHCEPTLWSENDGKNENN